MQRHRLSSSQLRTRTTDDRQQSGYDVDIVFVFVFVFVLLRRYTIRHRLRPTLPGLLYDMFTMWPCMIGYDTACTVAPARLRLICSASRPVRPSGRSSNELDLFATSSQGAPVSGRCRVSGGGVSGVGRHQRGCKLEAAFPFPFPSQHGIRCAVYIV